MNLRLIPVLVFSAVLAFSVACTALQLEPSHQPGWQSDDMQQVWNAWQNSCSAFKKKNNQPWSNLCDQSDQVSANSETVKAFFETNFKLVPITNSDGSAEGIITGYYEPVLHGSLQADGKYKYPVYGKPVDPNIQSLTRKQIETQPQKFKNNIILWVDDPYDLFFLHVQGSGRVQLRDGQQKSLVYAGNNGHDYTSIGKVLIDRGEMQREKVSLQSLKNWLNTNPEKSTELLQQNKRYIFLNLTDTPKHESGPRGSLNVPLTPYRSIAIDPNHVDMGSPIWLETTLPSENGESKTFNRLMFAQDTGAAIKGQVRADVFFGLGDKAEYLAGNMNQKGKMYLLVPR